MQPPPAASPPPPGPLPSPPRPDSDEATLGAEDSRPWFKRKRFAIPIAAVLLLLVIGALIASPEDDEPAIEAADSLRETSSPTSADDEESNPPSTTTEPPTTTTSTTAPPEAGTEANPDRLGTAYEITGDDLDGNSTKWTVSVDSVNFEGWPLIQAENQFNSAPPEGWKFMLVQFTLTYDEGASSDHPGYVADLSATGSNNQVYGTYSELPNGESGCGVIPNDIGYKDELRPGGTATGNLCVPVPEAEIADGSLRLLIEPTFAFNTEPKWINPLI